VPAPSSLSASPSAARRAFPRRAAAQGHELGQPSLRDERAIALSRGPGLSEDQLRRTEQAIERAVLPAQPSWRWFRPAAAWFHRGDGMNWARPAGPYRLVLGSIFPWDSPCGPPLWFMRLVHLINAHPVRNPGAARHPRAPAPATALILRRSFPTSAAGLPFVRLHELLARWGLTIRPSPEEMRFSSLLDRNHAVEESQPPGTWRRS